jgi:hypothetical protein
METKQRNFKNFSVKIESESTNMDDYRLLWMREISSGTDNWEFDEIFGKLNCRR